MGKKKRKKKIKPASKGYENQRNTRPGRTLSDERQLRSIRIVSGVLMDILLLVLVVVLVVKLAGFASEAMFFTDECYHSYIVNLTIENGQVPIFLPDIYSGSKNIQPPLFHTLGAIYKSLFGISAMPYFNILLFILLLLTMYVLIRVFIDANVARLSLLFLVSFPFIHQFSLAFYLEMLSALTFFIAIFLLFIAIEKKRFSFYIYAGIGGMILLLSKISGIIILPFYFICAAFYFFIYLFKKGKLITVTGPLITTCIAVAGSMLFFHVYTDAPMEFAKKTFVRPVNTLVIRKIFGKSERKSQEQDKKIDKIKDVQESFTANKGLILKGIYKGTGSLFLAALIAAVISNGLSLGRSRSLWIFIFFIYAFLIFLYTPAVAARHFTALVPIAALLGGYALQELSGKISGLLIHYRSDFTHQAARASIIISVVCFSILFVIDAVAVVRIPNYRKEINSKILSLSEPIDFIKENTPEDSIVFTMWAYSTFYHSDRASTWGANVKTLKDIYFVEDPDELFKRLGEEKITHIMIDTNMITTEEHYHTSFFTTKMVSNLVELIKAGKAEMIWPTHISSTNPKLANNLTLGLLPYGDRARYELFVMTEKGPLRFLQNDRPLDYYIIKLHTSVKIENEQGN